MAPVQEDASFCMTAASPTSRLALISNMSPPAVLTAVLCSNGSALLNEGHRLLDVNMMISLSAPDPIQAASYN
jgi:hypothetical protein